MVLPNGPFWEYVEETPDGRRMCRFCRHLFSKQTPITRFKFHWSGVGKRGTKICVNVPGHVREDACAAVGEPAPVAPPEPARGASVAPAEPAPVPPPEATPAFQEAALAAVNDGPPQNKQRTTSSSSNCNWAGNENAMTDDARSLATPQKKQRTTSSSSSCNLEGNENAMTDDARSLPTRLYSEGELVCCMQGNSVLQVMHPGPETSVSGAPQTTTVGLMPHVEIGGSAERLSVNEDEPTGDSSQPADPQEENDEVNNLAGNEGWIQIEVQGTEQEGGEGRTSSLAEAGNLMENMAGEMMPAERSISAEEPIVDAHETRGEASQEEENNEVDDLAGDAGSTFLLMGDDTGNEIGVTQPVVGASSSRRLACNLNEIKGDAIPTTKAVGQTFEDNMEMIWSWLMRDEISSIGIYGMGGVGKTTLVTQIYNEILEKPDTFFHVYWITVSEDFSIFGLQNSIAKCIGVDLSNEEGELPRAIKLSKALMGKQTWIMILDNLWNHFDLDKVGIPVQVKGCKLILTTQLLEVCQRMRCEMMMKVELLSSAEAWTLFMEKLRCHTALPLEVEQIAKFMAGECAGLPLGIITVAGAMKGVDDISEWRNALEELRQSRVRQDDMEEKVFKILRFSYEHLKDSTLQQCFFYCALFPEDSEIPREDLIGYLIDEGVIKGMKSREAEFDKGHSMLNTLRNVCLLECGRSSENAVKMHDLIRYMALQIQQENSSVMVKAGAQLNELPDAEEWTENLVRVSLMHNQIEEIPSSHSPRCPTLSTLLLYHNELRFIADSFFEKLHVLKVLDLSFTIISKLPDSVSDLVSLNALLLECCQKLRHVPSLKNLKTLKRLDLSRTALENVPQGMEFLSNLRYLRLNGCGQKEFPSGVLPKLSHLQVLIIEHNMPRGYAPVTVKGKEVACLRKLETLECYFEGHSDFMEYLKYRDEIQSLSTYQIFVGQLDKFCRNKSVGLGNFSIYRDGDFQGMFPIDVEELVINNCNDARSLCDVSPLIKSATELEVIRIWYCNNMESLVSSSWLSSAPLQLPSSNGIFSSLKEFDCYKCTSMKKLFPLVLLPNLVNLERIRVVNCEKMEEIIATRDEEGVVGEESSSCYSNVEFSLPKLKILELRYLPELKSICSAKLICGSLEEIEVWDCEKLKWMSVSLPLLDNRQPSLLPSLRRILIHPKEWWETVVEWEHPNTKDILSPIVKFWQ